MSIHEFFWYLYSKITNYLKHVKYHRNRKRNEDIINVKLPWNPKHFQLTILTEWSIKLYTTKSGNEINLLSSLDTGYIQETYFRIVCIWVIHSFPKETLLHWSCLHFGQEFRSLIIDQCWAWIEGQDRRSNYLMVNGCLEYIPYLMRKAGLV